MGGRTGRGGGRTRGRFGDQDNDRIDGQVGGQGSEDFIKNNDHRGCTYKEFLACNPKEYDGKGGAIVYTHWIKKIKSVQDMSGYRDNQKVKYTVGSFIDYGLGGLLPELFSDHDCKIHYHPGKANVVVDTLSRKERVKPKRVRAMNMTLQSSIKGKILAAQEEASDESAGLQKGLDEMI
ncbi:hypothetical protein Tco_0295220 [Tanacetum coccineum]